MPGLELFSTINSAVLGSSANEPSTHTPTSELNSPILSPVEETAAPVMGLAGPNPYYNARLDPKNFLEGELSWNPATRLRQMLARPGIVVAPGICDGISARCALEAGFDCMYQSGAATTASRLGQPDLAIATLNDFVQSAQMVCSLDPTVPVIADADTGFGGPAMVARTVTQYARAGVAAMHIEDQVQTKRCGHLLGKQVVSREEFVTRVRAAVAARDAIPGGSDFVVIGRTDSAQVLGMDEAIFRLKLAADAGADVCFIEGVRTADLLTSTIEALAPKPVLVNVISGGLTPSFTTREAEALGAKIIIFSLVSCVAAVHGIRAAMASLKKTGTDHSSAQGMDPKAFFQVMGLDAVVKFDAEAGGKAFEVI
ncbi:Phosphoenolpyruvate/pyruvate domain-containing protein [Epithele typhae]|uniref:Phosphoenolpyruvate/pyruvate domain-containing protein n=1 Tax=Epithele typhae TaxID=378194 RepID=UPI0020085238|nr:Phosphoenolpyruvate/pyruvate domain-containing protein [Epithele typhae]KAH9942171.1 Phosphoenolpyruvate/pyruvate domain-containing protein [Epithele typhae]